MKMNNPIQSKTTAHPGFRNACLASCRRLLAQIAKTKDSLWNEFRDRLKSHERVLKLALNEAEALAWQSGVPHLVFLTLAREKAEAVARWHARQQSLRPTAPLLAA